MGTAFGRPNIAHAKTIHVVLRGTYGPSNAPLRCSFLNPANRTWHMVANAAGELLPSLGVVARYLSVCLVAQLRHDRPRSVGVPVGPELGILDVTAE